MTDAQTQALLAIDASEDLVLYASAKPQNARNLNAGGEAIERSRGGPAAAWLRGV